MVTLRIIISNYVKKPITPWKTACKVFQGVSNFKRYALGTKKSKSEVSSWGDAWVQHLIP